MTRRLPVTLVTTFLLGIAPAILHASSHSEAPGTAKDRLVDDTDLYAFVAADAPDAVTFVGNWVPLLEPNGGPNFYGFDDAAEYYINIDNVGDCLDHIRFEFEFTTHRRNGATFLYNTGAVTSLNDPDLNIYQTAAITRIDNGSETVVATDVPVAPNYVGPVSMPDYEALAASAVTTLGDGTKVFIGPRDDPFFVDLGAVFDLLTIRKVPGNKGKGVDGVSGYNVLTIAIQVPMTRLTKDGLPPNAGNSVIGIYDSAERPATRTLNADGTISNSGPSIQVSRLGSPLVNEVVIPLQDKNKFNATKPTGDGAFLPYVLNPELGSLLNLLYGITVPPAPRNDLVAAFLTGVPTLNNIPGSTPCEMLRLNMAIPPAAKPKRLAVLEGDAAGFPNGRRLADDVVDIAERVVAGVLVPGFNVAPNNQLGDGIDVNDKPYLPYFPYVAPPHNPLDRRGHSIQNGASPASLSTTSEGSIREWTDLAPADPATSPAMDGAAVLARTPSLSLASGPGAGADLRYTVTEAGRVSVRIYDVQGRLVRNLLDQDAAPGEFRAPWDGRDDSGTNAGTGLYFARYMAGGQPVNTTKIVLQ
ncbi:MAG TPA: DUF4331 family protein [Candidatus Eisenbacteria bacterium]